MKPYVEKDLMPIHLVFTKLLLNVSNSCSRGIHSYLIGRYVLHELVFNEFLDKVRTDLHSLSFFFSLTDPFKQTDEIKLCSQSFLLIKQAYNTIRPIYFHIG